LEQRCPFSIMNSKDFANSGESVKRPRYTVDPFVVIICWYILKYYVRILNREARWYGSREDFDVSFSAYLNFLTVLRLFGLDFEMSDYVMLKKKAVSVYAEFFATTKLLWSKTTIMLPNAGGVLHPVDLFLKRMYDKYFPRQMATAMSTYKRTNPTLPLRLAHLEKYATPYRFEATDEELDFVARSILFEAKQHVNEFASMSDTVKSLVDTCDFSSIQIDHSSAAGYPYQPGKKKRDVQSDAEYVASELMHDDDAFSSYVSDHKWYTTGRARMQKVGDDDAGRLIIYAGYAYLLVALVLLQPWSRFMNRCFEWCGVGFSWMNCGANKLAAYMEADRGFAPKGFRYVSVDVSGWDTKLHPRLLACLERFYTSLLEEVNAPLRFRWRFLTLLDKMIRCSVVMPLGYVFYIVQGMKSGWAATANDNTLLHEIVFRVIMRNLGRMKHVLYGDDNFILVPDHVSDEDIISHYAKFGLVIKYVHSSRYIGDVDYLSKHIKYWDGNYYVFRDAVETHSRLLMPEELDPRRRNIPDPVIAVERVLGHLLDNPFNEDVRNVCYTILEKLKIDYGVLYVDISDTVRKKHPWRMFDTSRIPRKFPTVPSMRFIEDLYGVPIPKVQLVNWPKAIMFKTLNANGADADSFMFDSASNFCDDVAIRVNDALGKNSKKLVRRLSPFAQPKRCYGFHAARFEFAIKYFDIRFNNMLDLGSHPGACAASALKYCKHVVCVSKKPSVDKRTFCPYVVRSSDVDILRRDADSFIPHRPFDLQHDDVDIVGPRSRDEDLDVGLCMIKRARMNYRMVEQCLFTLKEVNWQVINDLYGAYCDYGHFDVVKPLFSNPWKPEVMVYLKRVKGPRMRRSKFVRMLNHFLNSIAPDLFIWGELMANAVTAYEGIHRIESNPNQTDAFEHIWIKDFG